VVKVSTAKKLAIAGQIAVRHLTQSRTAGAVVSGLRASRHQFGRVFKQLWLEVTGFTFLVLAGIGALAGFREYVKYQSGQTAGPGRLIVAVCFTLSFIWFGLSSFWRVKRRS
jgi:hypothetical protein